MYISFSDKIPKVTEIKVKQLHSQNTPQSVHLVHCSQAWYCVAGI